MSARSFESYIKDKLKENGIENDYLVNIRSEESYAGYLDKYPYPLNAEKEESEKNLDNILWEIKNEHEKLKNAFVGNIRSKRIFAEFILGKYNKEKSYTPNEDTLENLNKQSAFYTG